MKRTVLVTGATSGIGLATAGLFRQRSWRVLGTSRDPAAIPAERRIPIPFLGSYSATKLALRGFARCLRDEVRPHGVRVTVIEPGYFRTDLDLHREWLGRPGSPYSVPLARLRDRVHALSGSGQDPRRVAEKVWRAVCAADPPALVTVGSGAPAVVVAARLAPARLVEHLLRRHFKVST